MIWEDLKVYTPLEKEDLVKVKKDMTLQISDNLSHFGFKLYGRKLIKRSGDIFYIIHLDTRGSWMGVSNSLKTEITIASIYDIDYFVNSYEPLHKTYIENLIPNLKNFYQITKEYKLFADFITRKLLDYIIPFFEKYKNSKDILLDVEIFKNNKNLILFSELSCQQNYYSLKVIDEKLDFINNIDNEITKNDLLHLKKNLEESNWMMIDELLANNKNKVFKKLKIKN